MFLLMLVQFTANLKPVPFTLKDAASAELIRLEKAGILEKVSRADWAAPIVLVPK